MRERTALSLLRVASRARATSMRYLRRVEFSGSSMLFEIVDHDLKAAEGTLVFAFGESCHGEVADVLHLASQGLEQS